MTRRRFFCTCLDGNPVVLAPDESRHAVRVLRLAVGDEVTVFDGRGRSAEGKVVSIARAACAVEIVAVQTHPRPAVPCLTLFTALPRGQRQQYLFEKCTELGVARIVPTQFARSTVIPKSASMPKWRQWTIEAGKQSGSWRLPELHGPRPFSITLNEAAAANVRLVGAPTASAASLRDARRTIDSAARVAAWIGPEGGLTDEESAALDVIGAIPVRLADQVLRVETAAVAFAAAFALP